MDNLTANVLDNTAFIILALSVSAIIYLNLGNILHLITAILFLLAFFTHSIKKEHEIKKAGTNLSYLDRKYIFQLMGWSLVLILTGFIASISAFSEEHKYMFISSIVLVLISIIILINAIIGLKKIKEKR